MSGWLAEALTTSRLRLRPWRVGDEHAIVALKTDPQVRLFLGGSVPPEKAIATTRSQIADQNWGHFVIADLARDEAFGTVSFDRKRGPWELSFQLRPDRWGQGLMSEAVIAAADWFFANMDDAALIAVTQVLNLRTRALLERVGATRSDTFEEHGVAQVQYRLSRTVVLERSRRRTRENADTARSAVQAYPHGVSKDPRHPAVDGFLRGLTPIAVDTAQWPGGMRLSIAAYPGREQPPAELVSSVRCIVTVGWDVLVCEDSHPSVDVLPGGRCEPGESWTQTAQREVLEETGWRLDSASLLPLGVMHFRHLTPVPKDHPFPNPDFFQVVLRGEGSSTPKNWVDIEGWVLRSWLAPPSEAAAMPISACGRAFLALLNREAPSADS